MLSGALSDYSLIFMHPIILKILMALSYFCLVLPLPMVIITVGIRYQDYGVKTECDQLL